jgi:predicted nucleotidyltransferase
MTNRLYEIGLIDYLEKKLVPETIILFGSIRKGEYDNESDIDIFVASTKKAKLDLKKFEKILGHEIQIFIEKDINDLQVHLKNNVVNGIKLSGYFKINYGR